MMPITESVRFGAGVLCTDPCTKKLRSLLRHRKSRGCSCRGPEQRYSHYAPFWRMGNSAAKRPLEEIRNLWPENPRSCRGACWLCARRAVQALTEQIGMAVVPGVLFDHVR
jgi:hypothetical protein